MAVHLGLSSFVPRAHTAVNMDAKYLLPGNGPPIFLCVKTYILLLLLLNESFSMRIQQRIHLILSSM